MLRYEYSIRTATTPGDVSAVGHAQVLRVTHAFIGWVMGPLCILSRPKYAGRDASIARQTPKICINCAIQTPSMPTKNMSFSEQSSTYSTEQDLTLDIIRDPGFCGEWFNRFAQNAETHQVLYYCDVTEDSKLEIHRGNKYGPVVAKTNSCSKAPGATDLVMTGRRSGPEHIHHDERSKQTHFVDNGHRYHWSGPTGHNELVDEAGAVLAELSWPVRETSRTQKGKLVIRNQALVDPIVMSALVVQERADESGAWF
jgi:hypothetical protein